MKCGVVLVDKPAGDSSAAIVARVKRRLDLEKVGHAGTLDPMATGLLVCLCGPATRLAAFAEGGMKTYSGRIRFGVRTSTDDIAGEVLESSEALPAFDQVMALRDRFMGEIEQVPPLVSAVKVNGKRSYKLARSGSTHSLTARRVRVESFEIAPESPQEVSFRIHCSKGTYIRSIARDMGGMLGCGGCLAALRRESSQPFSVSEAREVEHLDHAAILDWSVLFPSTPRFAVEAGLERRLLGGDQRALLDFVDKNLQSAGFSSADRAIYYSIESGQSLGLLGRQGEVWNFVVNTPP